MVGLTQGPAHGSEGEPVLRPDVFPLLLGFRRDCCRSPRLLPDGLALQAMRSDLDPEVGLKLPCFVRLQSDIRKLISS